MRSIERYLVTWVLGGLVCGAIVLAAMVYFVSLSEMNEVFDGNLKQVALSVASYQQAQAIKQDPKPFQFLRKGQAPPESEIITQTWTLAGHRTFISNSDISIPFIAKKGFSRVKQDGIEWHVYTDVEPEGIVQAAQRVVLRHGMASDSASRMFLPYLVLIALVCGFVIYALRRGLRPLDVAAADVAARSVVSLEPINHKDLPREIYPLVKSINDLMQRLAVSFAVQQRFVADAAHELRTPVTALKLQLQIMERSAGEESRIDAINELRAGIERSQHLIQQLLHLSRVEPGVDPLQVERISLSELVRSVVGDWSVKAEQKRIDLGAEAIADYAIDADRNEMRILLNNLVENALRYGPVGGVVDVRVTAENGCPTLRVVDSGPGIPEEERHRVFDRFYRGGNAQIDAGNKDGSGLGLAIVKRIAERHGAIVTLNTAASGHGLEVRIVFPAANERAPSDRPG